MACSANGSTPVSLACTKIKEIEMSEKIEMFEIEHYKKPTDWAQVAMYMVSIIAIIVVALDIFYWRA